MVPCIAPLCFLPRSYLMAPISNSQGKVDQEMCPYMYQQVRGTSRS